MIPKIIHFFWFGDKELPDRDKKNIETWKKYCPDYEIKLWNEKNYKIPDIQYVQDAYKRQKWGHVSDYARLDVLYQYGGIYFDTDVEVVKNLNPLLNLKGFIGFENGINVNTGQGVGAEPGNSVIKGMMDAYHERKFLKEDNTCDLTPCPEINTEYLKTLGLKQNDKRQRIKDMEIFPTEYFCPKHILTGVISVTENTYSIHHFNGSWFDDDKKKKMERSEKLRRIFGMKWGERIISFIIYMGAVKNKIFGRKDKDD